MASEDPTGKMIFFPRLSGLYNGPPSVNSTVPLSRVDILASDNPPAEDDPPLEDPVRRPLNPLTHVNQPPMGYLLMLEDLPKSDMYKIIMGNIYEMCPGEMWVDYGENEEEKEWYLLTTRGREYENERVINRVIISDEYWLLKATCPIMASQQHYGVEIGVCRAFKYYQGGQETAWAMHEFRLNDHPSDPKYKVGDWVLCKIHNTQN